MGQKNNLPTRGRKSRHNSPKLRAKRYGLNPTKIIGVYFLSFFLVFFHQAGRISQWFDDLGIKHENAVGEAAFKISSILTDYVVPHGPSQLNEFEDKVLRLFAAPLTGETSLTDIFQNFQVSRTQGADVATWPKDLPARPQAIEAFANLAPENIKPSRIEQDLSSAPQIENQLMPPQFLDDEGLTLNLDDSNLNSEGEDNIFNPARVLLLGDSMMLEGLGPPLQRKLKNFEGLTVYRDGRYGTGLARLDVFDWLNYFEEMLVKYNPDLVVITLGANDTQDIINSQGKKRIHVATDEWNAVYLERVLSILQLAEKHQSHVFWVGLPIMGREPYGVRALNINTVVAQACQDSPNGRFWDSWLSVADSDGKYAPFSVDKSGKPIRIRGKDNIHLTEKGGEIMAEKFLAETESWATYEQVSPAEDEPLPGGISEEALGGADQGLGEGALNDDRGANSEISPNSWLVTEKSFFSQVRGKMTPYLVISPDFDFSQMADLAPNKTFSEPKGAIILLHGAWDAYDAWLKNLGASTLINLAQKLNVILIMPDGEPFGWYINSPNGPIESYFIDEFLPHILKNENIDDSRLALAGLSMGGHGGLTLALKYPEKFKGVSSISGVLDLTAHKGERSLDRTLQLVKILGSYEEFPTNWHQHSAHQLTEKNPQNLRDLALIIGVGEEDELTLAENRRYAQLLQQLDIEHQYHEGEGGHGWAFVAAEISRHLEFLAEALKSQ
ncbi:MAG: DUF459 domain-containing protein [Candidatus Adiutrix sp.]